MAKAASFTEVCYRDGWHWSVVDGEPAQRLVLEDDGSYRVAAGADVSWHDRRHRRFARVAMEGGQGGLEVSKDEFDAIQELLSERRGDGTGA